jgi:phosphopantothenoylcysteine decarboxylase / phosphopantothenate---cysteine ligase
LRRSRFLLTAGPTQEPLDPVRYLSNHSSGEMGLALAEALAASGARVTLVLGPVARPVPGGVEVIRVVTARGMSAAVRRRLAAVDAFVSCAAVCDWRFERTFPSKMKKAGRRSLTMKLVSNPDILAQAGRWKGRRPRPILVGFALETRNVEREARRKLAAKNLDLVIGNTPESFASPSIRPVWIERGAPAQTLPRMSKKALSSRISRWLAARISAAAARNR